MPSFGYPEPQDETIIVSPKSHHLYSFSITSTLAPTAHMTRIKSKGVILDFPLLSKG